MEEGALARAVTFAMVGAFLALLGLTALVLDGGSSCGSATCILGSLPRAPDQVYGPLFIAGFCFLFAAGVTASKAREDY